MWVITTKGFFSAVQHRDDPGDLLVRARNEVDIRALMEILPHAELIGPTENSDYRWRLRCSKEEWAYALAQLADGIDYANFKDAVKAKQGATRANVYMGVWSRLLALSDRPANARGWNNLPKCECGEDIYPSDQRNGTCWGCGEVLPPEEKPKPKRKPKAKKKGVKRNG